MEFLEGSILLIVLHPNEHFRSGLAIFPKLSAK